jgi:hypothetical protein
LGSWFAAWLNNQDGSEGYSSLRSENLLIPCSTLSSYFLAVLENAKFLRHKNRSASASFFFLEIWLGQTKQALTIYREDIRNRLEDFNPEK